MLVCLDMIFKEIKFPTYEMKKGLQEYFWS